MGIGIGIGKMWGGCGRRRCSDGLIRPQDVLGQGVPLGLEEVGNVVDPLQDLETGQVVSAEAGKNGMTAARQRQMSSHGGMEGQREG